MPAILSLEPGFYRVPLPSVLTCAALAAVFAGCVMLIAAHTYNPFIYFRF